MVLVCSEEHKCSVSLHARLFLALPLELQHRLLEDPVPLNEYPQAVPASRATQSVVSASHHASGPFYILVLKAGCRYWRRVTALG